jgi:DNA-binding IclR family transcriptional regulator
VLDAIMENGGEALSLADLARELRVPKSSLGNVCRELVAERLLLRIGNDYRLGPKLAALGAVFLASVDFVREFQDACITLEPPILHTTKLAVLGDHGDTIYLSRYDPTRPASLVIDVSVQQPAHCTASGKALLACLPEADFSLWAGDREDLGRATGNSIGSIAQLRREIGKIRTSGIALDVEECHEGVYCVATALASVSDPAGGLGLSFALLSQQASEEAVEVLQVQITKLAAELALRLGGGYVPLAQLAGAPEPFEDDRVPRLLRPRGPRVGAVVARKKLRPWPGPSEQVVN